MAVHCERFHVLGFQVHSMVKRKQRQIFILHMKKQMWTKKEIEQIGMKKLTQLHLDIN